MISKDCFVSIIEASKSFYEHVHKMMDDFNIAPENKFIAYLDSVLDALVDELEISYDYKAHYEPILYSWVFTHDWGRNYSEISFIVSIDGVKYSPRTPDELYDTLVEVYHKDK